MILKFAGALAVAFASFVGMLHGILAVQGKRTPETLGAYHDWPVVGGFFPKYTAPGSEPTEAELKAERAVRRLEQVKGDFRLPPPFTSDELKAMVDELNVAKAAVEATQREQAEERERLVRLAAELSEQRAELMRIAEAQEATGKNLAASAEELQRETLFIAQKEEDNLRTLAAIYAQMPPLEASKRLEKQDLDLAAKLLWAMEERNAGKILAQMEPALAVAINARILRRAPADEKRAAETTR